MATNEEIKELSIKTLFEEEKIEYLIPIYQRNYAWTNAEVEQLVMDIHSYSNKEQNYYIGTLVVFEKVVNDKKVFETIDGQQRLTTLSILLSVLKNEYYKNSQFAFKHLLRYESREISTDTLKYIYEGNLELENLNSAMENAYKTIKNYLKNNITAVDTFKNYLFKNVKILRVNVPKGTDLNHYFEIMNNRGEQLEKHEVLKARMLKELDDEDKKVFNDIWEACSDMSRYIQYGFSPEKRDKIFSREWNSFVYNSDFDSLKTKLHIQLDQNTQDSKNRLQECSFSIDDIINGKCKIKIDIEKKNDDTPDRFTSPINFPNFLLHVFKVTKNNQVTLDDKGLLDAFTNLDKKFVKEFGFNLLKLRFLLDNYVIKREYTSDKDEWSLKQAYKYSNEGHTNIQYKNRFDNEHKNKQILMILSMFHVSNPSLIYKYWLTGVLKYLYENYGKVKFTTENYIEYLERLAKLFFYNRYLSKEPQEFDSIIFNQIDINSNIDTNKLDQGTSVEHFIFNYLDYLLWQNNTFEYSYFNFSFSNSVEHFYPQTPIEGHKKIEDTDTLNNFGNLCLISVSKNAKLNNHPPSSKLAYYPKNEYDSLKQHRMMKIASEWDKNSILQHKKEMLEILKLNQNEIF
jgi:uncharacterized protein with ParB-like and HNH nuclease domain